MPSNKDMHFVEANYAKLQARYPGEWIAVKHGLFLAHGTPEQIANELRAAGINDAYLELILLPGQGNTPLLPHFEVGV